jgi:GAF domain-containing protein/nitrogen-specific signal transduction histidine kinase
MGYLNMKSLKQYFNNQDEQPDRITELEIKNQSLQRQINQFELVHSIGMKVGLALEIDNVLTQIVQAAVTITNAEIGAIMLMDEYSNQLHLRAKKTAIDSHASTIDVIIKDELANKAIQLKKPLRLSSEKQILKVVTGIIVKAILYVPILVGEKVIGVLLIQNETLDHVFSEEDEQFLSLLAEYAGIAIRNSGWVKKEQNLRSHSEILREPAIDISAVSTLEQLGEMLLDTLAKVVEFKKATVQIVNGLNAERTLIAYRGFNEDEIDPFLLRPLSQDPLAQRVFKENKPLILTNPANDPDWDTDRAQTKNVKSWIGLPLVHNQLLGLITLDHDEAGFYTDVLSDLLGIFCSKTAVVIENFNLLKSEQEQKALSDALFETTIALNTALDLGQVLSIILKKVEQVVPHESANIMLIEHGIAKVTKTNRYHGEEKKFITNLQVKLRDYKTFTRMFETQQPLLIANVKEYTDWTNIPGLPSVQSYLGVPICISNQVIGFLNLNSNKADFFTDVHTKRLQAFIEQIAVAIKKTQLLESFHQQTVHMEIINEILSIFSNKLNIDDLMQSVVDQITARLDCTHCILYEYVQETGLLIPIATSGHATNRSFTPGIGIVGWVFQNGESVISEDITKDDRFDPTGTDVSKPRSMIASPIKIGKRTTGVICVEHDEYGGFNETIKTLVETLGQQSGIAIERAKGLDLLHKITNDMVSLIGRDAVLTNIVTGAIKLTSTSTGIIYLLEINEAESKYKLEVSSKYPSTFIHPVPRLEIENGLTRTIIRERKCIVIPDIPTPPASYPHMVINPDLKKYYKSMLGIPLLYDKNVIGVLFVHDENPHEFTEIQISLLSTLAQLAAIAIRNAQLFDDMQRQNQRLNVLNQIGQNINTKTLLNSIDLSDIKNDLLTFIYDKTKSLMVFNNFYIAFWDEQSQHVNFEFVRENDAPVDLNDKQWTSREHGKYLTEYIARGKEPLLIQSNVQNWLTEHSVASIGTLPKSWLGAPMIAGTKTIGVVVVQNHEKENAFDDQLCEILWSIASETAIAIENARLYIDVQANNRMLGLLQQANNMLIGDPTKNMLEILQDFLMETRQAANAKYLAIVLINDEGKQEAIVRSTTDTPTDNNINIRPDGHSIQIWKTRESKEIQDTATFKEIIPLHLLIKDADVRSILGIPWITYDKVIGVVWLYYDEPRDFSLFEINSIRSHFDQAAFIYQNSILIKEQYRHREGMFSTVAHEIEIPLVSLASTANALKLEVDDLKSKQVQHMADKLIEQCRKLELQNETILAMFGRQKKPVEFKRRNLFHPIIKACDLFYSTAFQQGCEIKKPLAEDGSFPVIEMSEHHLALAFQNLVSNAVKYSYYVKPGVDAERFIRITGGWADEGHTKYTIRIRNYGVGIAPEEIKSKRIFQPFERGKYSGDRGRPGKGLGLALVWHVIVNIHNGSIDVISREVPGGAFVTTFIITLPVVQPENKGLTNTIL